MPIEDKKILSETVSVKQIMMTYPALQIVSEVSLESL